MADKVGIRPLAPAETIRFFESKGYKVGFAWQDVWQEEHARAFTVAKAMRLDILEDIRREVDAAIRDGTTLATFQKNLEPTLRKKGWWGKRHVVDPDTGEQVLAQLGSRRRLRVIYDTNLRTAHAAGRWARIQRTAERRPFLKYSAVLDGRTRHQHRQWHDTVLPHDHAFWTSHAPPNGWNCRCRLIQLGQRDLDRMGLKVSRAPAIQRRNWINGRTGEVIKQPVGIDPGFAYNAGQVHMRGLVPPPQSGPIRTPAINPPARMPMPAATPVSKDLLLPKGQDNKFYMNAFLEEFGTGYDKPAAMFTDKLGDPLMISDDLFHYWGVTRKPKVQKNGREVNMRLLGHALKDPDEIWWAWEDLPAADPPVKVLRKRYLKRFDVGGTETLALLSFGTARNGWLGATAFTPDSIRYLLKQRRGVLAWRKK